MSFENSARFNIGKGEKKQTYRCKDENVNYDSDSTCSEKNYEIDSRSKLKVELCRNFLDNKVCPYKLKCKFAHGLEELLQNSDLCQNFRTKKCKIFYEKGYCKFGERCNFKHEEAYEKAKISSQFVEIFEEYPEMLMSKKKEIKFPFFMTENEQMNE